MYPTPPRAQNSSYAVVDVETTGLSPTNGDRIVEIGVVITDGFGSIDHEWSTLIYPGRDPGPTALHGISNEMLLDAPVFATVADDLSRLMDGRILVAHNSRFDVSFLRAEWRRLGRDAHLAAFCTMAAARRAGLPAGLTRSCSRVGINIGTAHRALDDARATARLLGVIGVDPDHVPPPFCVSWKRAPWSGAAVERPPVRAPADQGWTTSPVAGSK